jgi:N6-L-threonylcarbamoyladenine synthase
MKVLGIETSCDETAAAVVELRSLTGQQPAEASALQGAEEQRTEPYTKYGEGAAQAATPQSAASGSSATSSAGRQADTVCRLLSNVVASSMDLHVQYGGVVPEIAARSHIESILPVIHQALNDANCTWDDIDALAVTYGAGLGGSLLVGVLTARTLAIAHDKPLYGCNHVEGHVYANFLTETALPGYALRESAPEFPMLAVIVSGGHSQLALFRNHFDYTLLGQTRDDAIGEAFDKVAKILGLPYPGGPSVGKKALEGDPHKYKLPVAHLDEKYEFSFSGLKTAVLRLAQIETGHDHTFASTKLPEALSDAQKANIAASFQYTAVKTIVDKAKLAYEEFAPASVVIAGGVAASPELRRQLQEALPLPVEYPDMKLCTDNGAMIATLGCFKAMLGQPAADPFTLDIAPNLSM